MAWIGAGENTAFKILQELFPKYTILTQYPLRKLIPRNQLKYLSKRQNKETLDLVLIDSLLHKKNVIIVRVQDRHHKGDITARNDGIQKDLLKSLKYEVVDLLWNEHEEIFKEQYNEKSINEVKDALQRSQIKLPQ